MTHLIRQHYLHVTMHGTQSDGLALQRRLTGLCEDALIPAVASALERCAPPTGVLCIGRLDIDVGTIRLEQLEGEFVASVARLLEKSLREETPPAGSSQAEPAPARFASTGPSALAGWLAGSSPAGHQPAGSAGSSPGARPGEVPGNVRHKTDRDASNEAFLHFLATGSLPWWYRPPEGRSLEQALFDCWLERATPEQVGRAANNALLRALDSSTVRNRLVRQFSPYFLGTLLSLLLPEARETLDAVLHTLRSCGSPGETRTLERSLWETAFAKLAAGGTLSESELVAAAWRAMPATSAVPAALAAALVRHWPGLVTAHPAVLPTGAETPSPHPESVEGIYLENAGLVLLHPFLARFFQGLGIAAGDELQQPERALCLLHYLATGQDAAPEYQLMLPKILCNLALETPVEADAALSAAELEEAAALLQAVIGHWGALRNSSPDALRGTFLLRPGKLSLRHGDWLLQVETKSCDILLDQLPWGLSMIKLPWMEQVLWVEWR